MNKIEKVFNSNPLFSHNLNLTFKAKELSVYKNKQIFSYKKTHHITFKSLSKNKQSYVPLGVWLTGAPILWNQGITGHKCIVGVIDSGIDPKHQDLKNILKRRSYIGDEDYLKLHSHGTHVAGTIAADGVVRGVAPSSIIYDYRVFDHNGNSKPYLVDKAIIDAANDGCNVINLSLGGNYGTMSIKNAVQYAISKGAVLVAAAGNEGNKGNWNQTTYSYPAKYRSVLSVASIDYDPFKGTTNFHNVMSSNRNSSIDVCAQGYKVLSTVKDNQYAVNNGTSMACPHVSGFAALMYQKISENFQTKDKNFSAKIFSIVKNHTLPINTSSLLETNSIIDSITGAGLVTVLPELPIQYNNHFQLPNLNLL